MAPPQESQPRLERAQEPSGRCHSAPSCPHPRPSGSFHLPRGAQVQHTPDPDSPCQAGCQHPVTPLPQRVPGAHRGDGGIQDTSEGTGSQGRPGTISHPPERCWGGPESRRPDSARPATLPGSAGTEPAPPQAQPVPQPSLNICSRLRPSPPRPYPEPAAAVSLPVPPLHSVPGPYKTQQRAQLP